MNKKLSEFTTLTFDCYGTLIDWERGIFDALNPLIVRANSNSDTDLWLAMFAEAESKIQSKHPNLAYPKVLVKVHSEIAAKYNLTNTDELDLAFGDSIKNWPAFEDSEQSLRYLKQHFKLVILSNVDNASFAMSNQHLKVDFDAIYTAEQVGSYKPNLANFRHMLSNLSSMGIKKSDILHTAQSLYHDMVPATEMGMATCWIDRRAGQSGSGATPETNGKVTIDFRFESLAEMVNTHQLELQNH